MGHLSIRDNWVVLCILAAKFQVSIKRGSHLHSALSLVSLFDKNLLMQCKP